MSGIDGASKGGGGRLRFGLSTNEIVPRPGPVLSAEPVADRLAAEGYACRTKSPSELLQVAYLQLGFSSPPTGGLEIHAKPPSKHPSGEGARARAEVFAEVFWGDCWGDSAQGQKCVLRFDDTAAALATGGLLERALSRAGLPAASVCVRPEETAHAPSVQAADEFLDTGAPRGNPMLLKLANPIKRIYAVDKRWNVGVVAGSVLGALLANADNSDLYWGALVGFAAWLPFHMLADYVSSRLTAKGEGVPLWDVLQRGPWVSPFSEKDARYYRELSAKSHKERLEQGLLDNEKCPGPRHVAYEFARYVSREQLEQMLRVEEDPDVALGGVMALQYIGNEESSLLLRQLFRAPIANDNIKMSILDSVARIEGGSALAFLLSVAAEKQGGKVSSHAREVLKTLPLPSKENQARMARSDNPQDRFTAALYQAARNDPRALPELLEGLNRDIPLAADALLTFGPREKLKHRLEKEQRRTGESMEHLLRVLDDPSYRGILAGR